MHNIKHNSDGTDAFAYNQQRGNPWHTLGTPFQGDQPLRVMLESIGADREVNLELEPVYVMTQDGVTPIEGKYATVREGNDRFAQDILGVVGGRFTVVQDTTVAELALEIVGYTGEDAVIDTMGLLGNGEKFFTYIRFEDIVVDPQGIADVIRNGLVATHAHDGSMALTFGKSAIRVVCNNTLDMALSSLGQSFTIKHTMGAEDKARIAAAAVGYAAAQEKLVIEKAERMLAVPGGKALDAVLRKVWSLDEALELGDRQKANRAQARAAVRQLVNEPTNNVGYNGWGVYNATVEYLDWVSPLKGKGSAAHQAVRRAERSITSGHVINVRKRQAAEAVLALA
jgi:phage/plasmid-like protein (TIGR03299 family)